MQVDAALERFTGQLRADGRSDNTVRQYRRHVAPRSPDPLKTSMI